MQIEFPSDIEEVNDTDLDILRCIHRNGPLWKMEITRKINRRRDSENLLALKDSITKQAVARRIERLHELGFLESSIISAKKENSKFILGYGHTSKGKKKLLECTRLILRDTVSSSISCEGSIERSRVNRYLEIYSDLTDQDIHNLTGFVKVELDDETSGS